MNLVELAADEAQQRGVVVTAVHLRLGPLSGVVPAALLSAYQRAREGSPLAGAELKITQTPIIAWCPRCEQERQIESPQRLCCPVCATLTPEVRGGRELELAGLEVADAAP